MDCDAAALPGFRRAMRVEPGPDAVLAMLEDDLHCMAVRLRHDGTVVRTVDAYGDRMPWSPCPGAEAKLAQTFAGLPLAEVTARRDKQQNCTHLHDLAVMAAAHAGDTAPVEYRVEVSDPREGVRVLQVSRDGALVHRWIERDHVLAAPPAIAGQAVIALRDWIATLSGAGQEAARLLQWCALVAHGRQMSDEQRHGTLVHRPSCYTMQPGRVQGATALCGMQDFTGREDRLLAGLRERFEVHF